MQRYHRQTILPQIGLQGQQQLLNSNVLIVGAGGLGHPVAQYLSAMGVGKMTIVDGDEVHITNLPRQILFNECDIGKNKAKILAQKISSINTDLKVSYEARFLDKSLAIEIFDKYDLVLDCTDNFESKFLINDVCALYDKPMVYGAVSQFEGHVGVFWRSKGSCYRCLYPKKPLSKIQNCAEAGVVGPVVGTIGSLQAMEAMKVLVGNTFDLKSLIGKISVYNFCEHTLRSLSVPVSAQCLCHAYDFNSDKIDEYQKAMCKTKSTTLLVDVRESNEWKEFHIDGSYSLPLSQLEAGYTPNFREDQEVVLICKAGARAKRAEEILKQKNFRNVSSSKKGVYEY